MLVESALIVFSILLALAVNEWAEGRRHAAAARLADSAGCSRTLAEWRAAVPEFRGFQNADLDATAWQTALTTGAASHVVFDTVAALARVYTFQARLEAYNDASIPSFDLSDQAMPFTARRAWAYLETVATNEDSLATLYAGALRLLRAPTR